jgi:hypothetical protein
MTERKEQNAPAPKQGRALWRRPTVRRIEAGEAEAAGAPKADIVFS